jgi:hypothetical protein
VQNNITILVSSKINLPLVGVLDMSASGYCERGRACSRSTPGGHIGTCAGTLRLLVITDCAYLLGRKSALPTDTLTVIHSENNDCLADHF